MLITACQVEAISVATFRLTESKGHLLSPTGKTFLASPVVIGQGLMALN